MKNVVKKTICVLLCIAMCFGFSSCSSNELTEDNVISTVEKVEEALKKLDIKTLDKYARSESMTYYSDLFDSEQNLSEFVKVEDLSSAATMLELVNAIFENLTMEVESVNLEEQTVDVSVNNKDLYSIAAVFTYDLTSQYSTQQIMNLLEDEEFVNEKISTLLEEIDQAPLDSEPEIITLKIEQSENNLVLVFDKKAENAVTGSAVLAVSTFLNA